MITQSHSPAVRGLEGMDAVLLEALRDGVIDPDLGVNVVDLGFVRRAYIESGEHVVVMTLTSASCPVTRLIEDMLNTAVVAGTGLRGRIEWEWTPAWSPADITSEGREQLGAIGFRF